ncbi:uncharacterized protein LOC123682584 [Harmonia axyridis]|uniref:uncharacterized protein LOC123682584 n=1 Tax=Harmonia axyridis TaxID=115357 RepID=UPI001E2787A0|nr:uncharacterized protein LOC123682584 [Harmonia axyridis]
MESEKETVTTEQTSTPNPVPLEKGFAFSSSGIFKKSQLFDETRCHTYIVQMNKECLTHNSDTYKIHIARMKGLKIINKILKKANKEHITFQNIVQIVWCTLSCVHHFQIRLCQSKNLLSFGKWRQSQEALETFDRLVQTYQQMDYLILKSIVKFFKEAKLWGNEFMSHDLLTRFLAFTSDRSAVIYELLSVCEEYTNANNITEARELLRIVDKMFEDYEWRSINETLLEKLFKMFFSSIGPGAEDEDNILIIQKGLEVCLRHVLESLHNHDLMIAIRLLLIWVQKEDVNESILLEIGSMLEYAAMNYHTKLYKESIPNDVIDSLLKLISSKNMLQSLLGNRVMHYLIDRCNNRLKVDTPRIFYENSKYNIVVNTYHEQDKQFFQKHREAFHASLLTSIMTHGMRQINLESSYTLIALLMLEIPCAYTAAAGVCLAMAIQEATFDNDNFNMNQSHRLHATVMAIMSLVCYIFNAKVFYEYINTIIDRRAEFAPHLNPPLKRIYEYNQHHVHWDKPELFFEDWEARYGLWKCFKQDENKTFTA